MWIKPMWGGLLDIREGRKLVFRIAVVEEIKPHVIQEPVTQPVEVEEVEETTPGDWRDSVDKEPEPVIEEPKPRRRRRRKTDD